jgi:PAS domain S-box-containing protein/putative nucleotidyltransferase with HDIG domain
MRQTNKQIGKGSAKPVERAEEEYQTIINTAMDGFWITAMQGHFLDVNDAYCDLIGYSREELLKMRFQDMEAEEKPEETARHIQRIIETGHDRFETQHRCKDGRIVDIEVSVNFRPSHGGRLYVFLRDITARRQAEQALQKAHEELELRVQARTAELAKANEVLKRENDTRTVLNTLLRLSLEDISLDELLTQALDLILSIPWLAFESRGAIFLAEDDQVLVLKSQRGLAEPILKACAHVPFGRCLCGRAAAEQKTRFADRLDVHHETTYEGIGPHGHYCVPILSAGKTLGVITIYLREGHRRDIQEEKFLLAIANTLAGSIERKGGEEILKKLSSVVEQTTELVFITNYDGVIEYVNPAFERLTGYAKDESIGQTPRILKSGKHTPDEYKQLWETIRAGKVLQGTVVNRKKNGELFYEEKIISPLRDEKGNITHFVSTGRDITERKRAEERIQTQLQRLAALREIDMAITGSLDLQLTLNVVLEQTTTQLGIDAASVLLLNPHSQTLTYAAGRGFRTDALQHTRLRLGEGFAGRAVLERQLIHIPDLRGRKTDFLRSPYFSAEGFVAYYVVPLIAKGEVKGVLEVFHRALYEADDEWRAFLETLAGQAAITLDNAMLFNDLQRSNTDLTLAYDATIEGWSHALDLRDKETEGHTQRVTELTERLARTMGLSEAELVHIRRGALLHDIGKMGVPDHILLKPDKLTDEEWAFMRQHPQFAFDMLAPIAYLRQALDIPYCHHEKWDGSGYPRGLKGEQIPLAARIFAVIDVHDALTSDRPYRKAWSREKTLEHIKTNSGTHFDPKVVEAFISFQQVSKTSN